MSRRRGRAVGGGQRGHALCLPLLRRFAAFRRHLVYTGGAAGGGDRRSRRPPVVALVTDPLRGDMIRKGTPGHAFAIVAVAGLTIVVLVGGLLAIGALMGR